MAGCDLHLLVQNIRTLVIRRKLLSVEPDMLCTLALGVNLYSLRNLAINSASFP